MRLKPIFSVAVSLFLFIVPLLALNIPAPAIDGTESHTAQDGEMPPWERTNGPYGGLINSIEIDPTNPSIIYAAGGGLSIYKSINSGASWSVIGSLASSSRKVVDFAMSPANPQVMYALTQGDEYIIPEFFMSVDGGEDWSQVDQNMNVFHFAVHPTNPMFILAVMWNAFVFVTDDGGASWTNVTGDLPREAVVDIAISGDGEYWAGLGDFKNESGSLYHTTDGGVSWQREDNFQPPMTFINSIMVHPDDPSIVYVSYTTAPDETVNPDDSYLSRTMDAGATWDELNTTTTIRLLAIVPGTVNDTIYVSYGPHVMRTSDYGIDWEVITPPPVTSDINDIAIDPTDNKTIYIPRRTYGIYKSTDGGKTYVTLTEGLDNTNACLVVVPHDVDSETVYVAAVEGTGTFRTDDAGGSWFYLDGGGINHSFTDEIRVSPHDSNTVWQIADIGQIFITNNKGTNWTTKYHPQHGYGFRYSSVHTIESAPSDAAIIYAIKSGWGPFRSDDGGLSWDFLATSEVDYSYTIAIHPFDPDTVYSGYNPKPFQDWAMVRKSTDGGMTWETVLNVTGSNGITSVAIDPNSPNVVYAGSIGKNGGEVYKTIDGGLNWAKLNDNFTMSTVMAQPQLVVDPSNPAIAYIGTWLGGTWKTVDAGATWGLLGTAPASATAIKIDPQNSNTLYLADRSTPTVWKSVDAGDTWFDIADFTADGAFLVNNLFVDGDIVYCATFGPPTIGGDLYKSIDAGATWTKITGTLPRSVLDIAIDPVSPEIVYVTTHVKGAYKSVNGGSTWNELVGFPDVGGFDIEVNASNPTILYAATLGETSIPDWVDPTGFTFTDKPGVYKSIDSGLTWTSSLNTTDKCRAVRFYPGNTSVLYAVVHGEGIFVSDDAGVTWTNYVLGLDTTGLTSLDIQGDTIYVGTQGYGVYSGDINTADYSVTWQPNRSNKPIPQVYSMQIVVDPNDSNRIYVGSYPGGLYRSDDGGVTFYDKNFQTPSIIATDPLRQGYYAFALNSTDTNNVWLGTWGGGVFRSLDAMDHNVHADGLGMPMMGKHIYQLAVSPNPPYTVYAATEEGVWITEDAGATWTNFSAGLLSLQVRSIEITAGGGLLCGTLGYGMHVFNPVLEKWVQLPPFSNLGNVWPIWNDRPSYQYSSLLFHPTDPNTIYIGVFPAGIYKSVDGGETWFESNTGFTNDGVFALVNHPQGPEIIYAGTYNGVSRSMDYGATWEKIEEGMPPEQWVFSIDFDPRNPSIMYACSKNGENEGLGVADFRGTVMKSIDAGETWFEIKSGLNTTQEFYKIIVDKHSPDTIYLATEREGVFISYNGGDFWEPWNEGLTNLRAGSSGNNVANPMAQSADGRYLYFGTFGSGVFRRTTYIPPTTTTSATTTTTPSPTTPSGPPPSVPVELMVIVVGVFAVAIVLLLMMRLRKGSQG
ncbi:MAG: WD40/YVTN/BNR-like repeat-containing protein [Candidatus Thorarchaeota archaeon]